MRDTTRRDVFEGSAFGEELAEEAVGVLAGASLPGTIRVGEEDQHLDAERQELVLGELFAAIEGDTTALLGWQRAQEVLQRSKTGFNPVEAKEVAEAILEIFDGFRTSR